MRELTLTATDSSDIWSYCYDGSSFYGDEPCCKRRKWRCVRQYYEVGKLFMTLVQVILSVILV